MRDKCQFWLEILALLSVLTIVAPQQGWAAQLDPVNTAIAGQCSDSGNGASGGGTVNAAFNPNNQVDNMAAQNHAGFQQLQAKAAANVGPYFPTIPINTQCLQSVVIAMQAIFAVTSVSIDPVMAALKAAVLVIIQGVINAVCSEAMTAINSLKTDIVNATSICLPLPTFGIGSLPLPTVQPCALQKALGLPGGGSQFNFVFPGSMLPITPGYSGYSGSQFFKGN